MNLRFIEVPKSTTNLYAARNIPPQKYPSPLSLIRAKAAGQSPSPNVPKFLCHLMPLNFSPQNLSPFQPSETCRAFETAGLAWVGGVFVSF